jgi:hypothetical protein
MSIGRPVDGAGKDFGGSDAQGRSATDYRDGAECSGLSRVGRVCEVDLYGLAGLMTLRRLRNMSIWL